MSAAATESGGSARAKPAGSKPSSRRGWVRKLAAVMLIALLGAGAWFYLYVPFMQARSAAAQRAQSATDSLAGDIAALATRLDALAAQQTAQVASQTQLAEAQQAFAVQLANAAGARDADSWVLAEIEYLVLAASQRLALAGDVATAQAALLAADERAKASDRPEFVPVRAELAHDIAALAAVPRPDLDGLAFELDAVMRRVDSLPVKPIADTSVAAVEPPPAAAPSSGWRGLAAALWQDLMSLVEVAEGDLPDSVLFDPKLRYFLTQTLKLELSGARLALVSRDAVNFRAALDLASEVLERYYDGTDGAVRSAAEVVARARAVELAPTLPTVSASLSAVRTARAALATPAP